MGCPMTQKTYLRCKESDIKWIGKVPEHWEVKKLKYCLLLATRKIESRKPQVALENIESWTGRFIKTETEFEGDGIAFEEGDILFGKLRPYLAKVFLAHSWAITGFHGNGRHGLTHVDLPGHSRGDQGGTIFFQKVDELSGL